MSQNKQIKLLLVTVLMLLANGVYAEAETSAAIKSKLNNLAEENIKLSGELQQEKINNRKLIEENELFKTAYDVFDKIQKDDKTQRLEIDILREEIKQKNKEIQKLRLDNDELLKRRESYLSLKTAEYEKRNKLLKEKMADIAKYKDEKIEKIISEYENKVIFLEEQLNLLTDGQWSFVYNDKKINEENSELILKIKEQKVQTEELKNKIDFLEKMYTENKRLTTTENDSENEKSQLYLKLGKAYLRAGDYQSALEAFLYARNFKTNTASVHYYLGLVYQYYGNDKSKALASFREYLYQEPDGEFSKSAEKIIDMIESGV